MRPTKRNHINPCFWTALWNETYFNNFVNGKNAKKARDQKVYTLDFRSPRILFKKVDDVHFVENLGLILADGYDLVRSIYIFNTDKVHFSKSKEVVHISEIDLNAHYLLDVEKDFTLLEEFAGYKQVLKTAIKGIIDNEEDRIYLACFLIFHQLRSEKFITSLINEYKQMNNPKLEGFLKFRNIISNHKDIYNAVLPLIHSRWTIIKTKDFMFPLSDNPIMKLNQTIWVVISPKHLLEIDTSKKYPGRVKYKEEINTFKYNTLRKTIINNTYREIIFTDIKKPKNWKKSAAYIQRKKSLGY